MLLNFDLPTINAYMSSAIIDRIHATEDSELPIGGKLFDLMVDLSAAAPHDCPPIVYYRIVVRERVWLRKLVVRRGDDAKTGSALALFSSEPNEPLEGQPVRQVRVAIAGIIPRDTWDDADS